MRVVLQRVTRAAVAIGGDVVGRIGPGLLVLVGIQPTDTDADVEFLADKLVNLRIFADEQDKMNRSLLDIGGELLVVSQFTLYGDCRKGRRPSFVAAAPPEVAIPIYERFLERLRQTTLKVETGWFGAMMAVELINDGPVTFVLESET